MKNKKLIEALEDVGVLKFQDSPGFAWNIIKTYLGNRAIDFDTECIESSVSYETIFVDFQAAIREDLRLGITAFRSFFDHDRGIVKTSLKLDGEIHSTEWKQESDWVSACFFEFLDNVLMPKLPGKIVPYISLDQCYRALYLPREIADTVNEIFREYEKNMGY